MSGYLYLHTSTEEDLFALFLIFIFFKLNMFWLISWISAKSFWLPYTQRDVVPYVQKKKEPWSLLQKW